MKSSSSKRKKILYRNPNVLPQSSDFFAAVKDVYNDRRQARGEDYHSWPHFFAHVAKAFKPREGGANRRKVETSAAVRETEGERMVGLAPPTLERVETGGASAHASTAAAGTISAARSNENLDDVDTSTALSPVLEVTEERVYELVELLKTLSPQPKDYSCP